MAAPAPLSDVHVLLVSDDGEERRRLTKGLEKSGCVVTSAADAKAAVRHAKSQCFELGVVDLVASSGDVPELLRDLQMSNPDTHIILMTGRGGIVPTARDFRESPFYILQKPCQLRSLLATMQRAYEHLTLRRDNLALREIIRRTGPDDEVVGTSAGIRKVMTLIKRFAGNDKPVLIDGEPGTEKETVARAIWAGSPRAARPFVAVSASRIRASQFERELFGCERGASEDTAEPHCGLFESADGATVFLDEIGSLTLSAQKKLLRVIERGELVRVGSSQTRHVDVRVLAGASTSLEEDVEGGAFRRDLLYHINVSRITIPPLRKRLGDVPGLAEHVLRQLNGSAQTDTQLSEDASRLLEEYQWPGNVRELANVVERAAMLAGGSDITAQEIRPQLAVPSSSVRAVPLEEVEREHIVRVLEQAGGNKSRAAKLLGMSRRKLYRLIEKFAPDAGADL